MSSKSWLRILKAKNGDSSERGASLVEYALLVALIAVVAIPSIRVLGGNENDKNGIYGVMDGAGQAILGGGSVTH